MDNTKRRILAACVCPMHAASISGCSGLCSWVGLGLAGRGCGGLVPIYENFSNMNAMHLMNASMIRKREPSSMNASGRPAPEPSVWEKIGGIVAPADLNNEHGTIKLYLNTINKIKPSFIHVYIYMFMHVSRLHCYSRGTPAIPSPRHYRSRRACQAWKCWF